MAASYGVIGHRNACGQVDAAVECEEGKKNEKCSNCSETAQGEQKTDVS